MIRRLNCSISTAYHNQASFVKSLPCVASCRYEQSAGIRAVTSHYHTMMTYHSKHYGFPKSWVGHVKRRVNIASNVYWRHHDIKLKLCCYVIRESAAGVTCGQPIGRWLPSECLVGHITQQHNVSILHGNLSLNQQYWFYYTAHMAVPIKWSLHEPGWWRGHKWYLSLHCQLEPLIHPKASPWSGVWIVPYQPLTTIKPLFCEIFTLRC